MYNVLLVDDEPTSLNHMQTIIEKKCPEYEVTGRADNGKAALDFMEQELPDVLITDVRMPVMDGLKLVSTVKKRFPDVLSVIVSGHQEFDYVKEAIQSGVCDYLLKPLKPADMRTLLEEIRPRLHTRYYEKRKQLIRSLCNHVRNAEINNLARYFPAGRYYSAIIRKNGLPKRFGRSGGIEIFSMEEEQIFIYGRDEMEALYLFPESLLSGETFEQVMRRFFERECKEGCYVTAVVYEEQFDLKLLPDVMQKLYRKLDEAIIVGESQMLSSKAAAAQMQTEEEREALIYLSYLVKYKETSKIPGKLKELFELWQRQKRRQLYVEGKLRYLFQIIHDAFHVTKADDGVEFEIDDAFFYAANMQELTESVLAVLAQLLPAKGEERADDKRALFHSILSYLENHMEETMTIHTICMEFGLSQTSLSKLFRIYENTSFSNYLTMLRIERAKKILNSDPDAYIKNVAERVGYGDQFYFSRIFRSVVGVCPSEYCESFKAK